MKKLFVILAVALGMGTTMVSCNGGSSESNLKTPEDSLSYYFGQMYGYGVAGEAKQGPDSAKFNKAEFIKGLELVMKADTSNTSYLQGIQMGAQVQSMLKQIKETQHVSIDAKLWLSSFKKAFMSDSVKDPNSYQELVMGLMKSISEKAKAQDPKAVENKKAGEAFLNKTAKEAGVKKTASGLLYKVVKEGNGAKFKSNDKILVKYDGKHINGETFDNGQGKPVPMSPAGVVPGMSEALQMMSPGAHYVIYLPANLAYGVEGGGPIGPNEVLMFDVETLGAAPEAPAQGQPAPQK